jgi:telomerase reverse transcriptase
MVRYPQYTYDVRKSQVSLYVILVWLYPDFTDCNSTACLAFEKVLAAKQSNYQPVVKWLRKEADRLASGTKHESLQTPKGTHMAI